MKPRALLICFFGLLIGIGAVDSMPDPPAVSPRTVSFAFRLWEVRGEVPERRSTFSWSFTSRLQVRWIAFTSVYEPNLPVDWIAMTAFAADPSPPALADPRPTLFPLVGKLRPFLPEDPLQRRVPENKLARQVFPILEVFFAGMGESLSIK